MTSANGWRHENLLLWRQPLWASQDILLLHDVMRKVVPKAFHLHDVMRKVVPKAFQKLNKLSLFRTSNVGTAAPHFNTILCLVYLKQHTCMDRLNRWEEFRNTISVQRVKHELPPTTTRLHHHDVLCDCSTRTSTWSVSVHYNKNAKRNFYISATLYKPKKGDNVHNQRWNMPASGRAGAPNHCRKALSHSTSFPSTQAHCSTHTTRIRSSFYLHFKLSHYSRQWMRDWAIHDVAGRVVSLPCRYWDRSQHGSTVTKLYIST
jgi:hypothetical protein